MAVSQASYAGWRRGLPPSSRSKKVPPCIHPLAAYARQGSNRPDDLLHLARSLARWTGRAQSLAVWAAHAPLPTPVSHR